MYRNYKFALISHDKNTEELARHESKNTEPKKKPQIDTDAVFTFVAAEGFFGVSNRHF